MDIGSNETDVLLKLLQYISYIIVAIFAYFGKKVLNDVSKIKETKADKQELIKLEDKFEKKYDKLDVKTNEILDKVTLIWQYLAKKPNE